MNDTAEMSGKNRKSLRVLILFTIFALCVAGAWWMSRHRGSTLLEGKSVLAEIRQEKLKAFWGEEESTQWFLVRNGAQNIGWLVQYRKLRPDGSYEGGYMKIILSAQGPRRITSRWILNNEATHGVYVSDESVLGQVNTNLGVRMLKQPLVAARIEMNEGKLNVIQRIKGADFRSSADIPEGYVPEGTMDLVSYIVARRKTRAKFRMIVDSLGSSENQTAFVTVDIQYSGMKPLSPEGLAVIVKIGNGEQLCFFDKTGKLEKQVADEISEVAVSEAEVVLAFPDADVTEMLKDYQHSQ